MSEKIKVQNLKTGQIKMMTPAAINQLKSSGLFGHFEIIQDIKIPSTGVPPDGDQIPVPVDENPVGTPIDPLPVELNPVDEKPEPLMAVELNMDVVDDIPDSDPEPKRGDQDGTEPKKPTTKSNKK